MKRVNIFFTAALLLPCIASAGFADREKGFKVGERMTIRPYVSLSITYDSNVDQQKDANDGSAWIINPGVGIEYLAENWKIEGSVWYDYHAYNEYSTQLDTSSYGERLNIQWANSANNEPGWSLIIRESYQQISQDDDMTNHGGRGIGRDRKQFTFDAALERRITERFHGNINTSYYLLDYDNDVNKYAALYGWKRLVTGAEMGYAMSRWFDFILAANYQWYWQDNDFDRTNPDFITGSRRGRTVRSDSRGWSVMGGVATRATERIDYRVLAGWSRFEYGEGTSEIDGWTYQVSGRYKIDDNIQLMLLGSSYYQPSEREFGRAIKVYTASMGLAKSFVRGKVTGTLDLAFRKEANEYTEYEQDNYDEDIWTARVGLNYNINRFVSLFGRVEFQTEDSRCRYIRNNIYDYDRWRATLGLRLTY